MKFLDLNKLTEADYLVAHRYIKGDNGLVRDPDFVICGEDGLPYLYRWHVIPRNYDGGNVYFHIQIASDPERPLHDHPWDNTSVILSGGYDELMQDAFPFGVPYILKRRKGQTVFRQAHIAHRLILPDGIPYTMTQFTTGPKTRDWGFWIKTPKNGTQWFPHQECHVVDAAGNSKFVYPKGTKNV